MDIETPVESSNGSGLGPDQIAALKGAWDQIVGQSGITAMPGPKTALEVTRRFVEDVKAIDEMRKELGLPAEVLGALVEYHAKRPATVESHSHFGRFEGNALIEGPRASREVLPMSSGVPILPGQSAQITARPQRCAFRPERFFVSNAVGEYKAPRAPWWKRMWPWYEAPQPLQFNGAADWVINDIRIGSRSQFCQSGDVPGDMFSSGAVDAIVSFETAQVAMDIVAIVTYVGANPNGQMFNAAMIGTAAIYG